MTSIHATVDGLRNARARQLRARLERPIRRRIFPSGTATSLRPLDGAAELWRSTAFAAAHDVLPGSRLAGFQSHYGEDVLAAARVGDALRARELIGAWLRANPPRSGDPWHPYTVSTRVGNWVAAATLLPQLADSELATAVHRHAGRLLANVEDDVLGNHVIRNARGLALAGASLGDDRFTAAARSLLQRELPGQVLADGGHYERSPAYHRVVMRDLMEIALSSVWPEVDDALSRMGAFAAASTRPDGAPAQFNDGAVDLAPSLEVAAPPAGVALFPDSGYAFVRDDDLWLAFDCGDPSPRYLPPHAHADILSFQLWHRGRPLVVDPGTYTYKAGDDRQWFRGTAAHSTIALDGRDQLELWGAFRGSLFPRVHAIEATGPRALSGAVRWRNGVVHRRTITWDADYVRVADELLGDGVHRVRSTLPLGSGAVDATASGANASRAPAWLSERFGEKRAIEALVIDQEFRLPCSLGWEVRLAP
jgi:hypothetical protein